MSLMEGIRHHYDITHEMCRSHRHPYLTILADVLPAAVAPKQPVKFYYIVKYDSIQNKIIKLLTIGVFWLLHFEWLPLSLLLSLAVSCRPTALSGNGGGPATKSHREEGRTERYSSNARLFPIIQCNFEYAFGPKYHRILSTPSFEQDQIDSSGAKALVIFCVGGFRSGFGMQSNGAECVWKNK